MTSPNVVKVAIFLLVLGAGFVLLARAAWNFLGEYIRASIELTKYNS